MGKALERTSNTVSGAGLRRLWIGKDLCMIQIEICSLEEQKLTRVIKTVNYGGTAPKFYIFHRG